MDILTVARHSRVVFPFAIVAAVAMVFISEGSYWQSIDKLADLNAIGAARTSIQSLQQSILAAETGQRGYLLTDRKEYLLTYDKALKEIDESFSFLDGYYAGQAKPTKMLRKVRDLTDTKLSELAVATRLHDEGKSAASTDIVLSELNKRQMDAIRALSTDLLEHEALNASGGTTDLHRTLMLSRIGMAALSAVGLFALFLYLRQTYANKAQQLEQKRVVQAERDRLEVEVVQRTAQLTELTRHVLTAREDERNRLARNLHDELGALLTSAKLDAARIRSRLAGTAPEALERLAHLVETLNRSIALGRDIIEDLRPSTLGNLGLVATLEILVRDFTERSGVEAHCALVPVKLGATAELVVYRLVQEAITNITKYASARQVWVGLAARDGRVHVSVRDDGVGFDSRAKQSSAYGLVGMRFRVEAEGGTLVVVSARGQGTSIQVTLPQSTAAAVCHDAPPCAVAETSVA